MRRGLERLLNVRRRILGVALTLYLKMLGAKVGRGLKCRSWPSLRVLPDRRLTIGDNVSLGRRINLLAEGGELIIGNNVNLTQDITISAAGSVHIGDDVQVAEYVSIRDSDHGMGAGVSINRQPIVSSPVFIGRDVWIASGCRILRGAKIPDGCVIGANSVVLGSTALEPGDIAVGAPARRVSNRTSHS